MPPEGVDKGAGIGEIPECEVGARSGGQSARRALEAEGAGGVHRGAQDRLLGAEPPAADGEVEGEEEARGERRSRIEIGRDRHGDPGAAEGLDRGARLLPQEVGRDGEEHGHRAGLGERPDVVLARLLEMVAGEGAELRRPPARPEGVELLAVGAEAETEGVGRPEEPLHVLDREGEGFDVDVDETGQPAARDFGEERGEDRLEIRFPRALRRHRVGGETAGDGVHPRPRAERRDEFEKAQFLLDAKTVAALDLDGRHPLAGESGEARGRDAEQGLVVRRPHRPHGCEETAARPMPSGIIVPVEPREVVLRAVSGEEGVGVTIDKARKKKRPAGVDDPSRGAPGREPEGAHAAAVDGEGPARVRGEPPDEGGETGVDHKEVVHGGSGAGGSRRLAFRYLLAPEGFVTDTALVLDGTGRIVALEPAGPPWDGWCALPAMVDGHSHAFHRLLTGLGERAAAAGSFWSWRALMYRAAARLTPEDLEPVATVAYEALRAGGYASVGEFHYLHRDAAGALSPAAARALARAAERVGVRLVLIPALYQRGGYGRAAEGAQERFLTPEIDPFLDYAAALPEAGRAVAVHSLRAVDPAVAADFVARARARFGADCRLHIHAAEQHSEVEEVRRHEGRGPLAVLDALGLLDPRTAVVHATHASAEERALLARRGARLVLCPQTEAYLGDGLFPLRSFQEEGGRWAIGSDANTRAGALDELRLLEYEARLVDGKRVRLDPGPGLARALWTRGAREGAHVLALPAGEIRPGCFADLLVLDPSETPWSAADPDVFLDACLLGDPGEALASLYVAGERRPPLAARDPVGWNAALARFRRLQEELAS